MGQGGAVTAVVTIEPAAGGAAKLSGHVTHALTAKGQTTTLNENWSLKPG
jgi:hypothetical protein